MLDFGLCGVACVAGWCAVSVLRVVWRVGVEFWLLRGGWLGFYVLLIL